MLDSTAAVDKILVCVSASTSSANVIRYAATKAEGMHTRFFAVHVETPRGMLLPEDERNRAMDNMRLAEQLGAETATLTGRNIAEETMRFAREKGITRIIAGKPGRSLLRSIFLASPVDRLVHISGEIDIEIVSGESGEAFRAPYRIRSREIPWSDYGTGLLFYMLATGLCFLMFRRFDLSNLIMVYLLAVMVTAIETGRGPAIAISLLSVLSFDFFFVPPRFSFTVDDAQYIVTFIVMFAVSLTISHLTELMRRQTRTARLQERQAAAMHGLSRQLAGSRSVEKILKITVEYISEIFDSKVIVLLPDKDGRLKTGGGDPSLVFQKDVVRQLDVASKAFKTGESTGWGTQHEPENEILYAPLQVADLTLGVVALRPGDPDRFLMPDQRYLFESLVKQVALSLEVEFMAERCIPLQSAVF
ncbi:Osmosensitive K+ channel signal transduction histidine kinase (fragment) [Syntrophobacter sp. SbD1]